MILWLAFPAFVLGLWYWLKLLRFMLRTLFMVRKAHKQGLFMASPPRGRVGGYFPEAAMLGEAAMIEQGVVQLGSHGGLDSLDPL